MANDKALDVLYISSDFVRCLIQKEFPDAILTVDFHEIKGKRLIVEFSNDDVIDKWYRFLLGNELGWASVAFNMSVLVAPKRILALFEEIKKGAITCIKE